MALTRLCICAGSPEPSLLGDEISFKKIRVNTNNSAWLYMLKYKDRDCSLVCASVR